MIDEVRRIRAEEWREYRELRLEALKDSPLAFLEQYDVAVVAPDESWRERVLTAATSPTRAGFVAVEDGRFIGKTSCFIEEDVTDETLAHVVAVYVTPAARGRARGAAAGLMAAALDWAFTQARAERIHLFVVEDNDRAAAFYRRMGFVLTGFEIPHPVVPSYMEREMEYRAAADGPARWARVGCETRTVGNNPRD
jgi:RimJ/RimL family protein N-acetyltransferase